MKAVSFFTGKEFLNIDLDSWYLCIFQFEEFIFYLLGFMLII